MLNGNSARRVGTEGGLRPKKAIDPWGLHTQNYNNSERLKQLGRNLEGRRNKAILGGYAHKLKTIAKVIRGSQGMTNNLERTAKIRSIPSKGRQGAQAITKIIEQIAK